MQSSNVSFRDLIAKANSWRKSVINKLWESIKVIGDRSVISEEIIESIFADFLQVGHRPTDLAFSNQDVQYFIDRFINNRKMWGEQLADLRDQKGSWVRAEMADRSAMMVRANVMVNILNEEKTRRINDEISRKENERAAHEAWLAKQREKYAVKPKVARVPNHKPHADKLIGKGLEALATIKEDMILSARKEGKFVSVRPVKKAELPEGVNMEALKTSGECILPDFRKITAKKSGAVTKYTLHE
jgi:hypothetical protein